MQLPDDTIPWGAGAGQAEVLWQPFGVNAVAAVAYASNGDSFGILETLPDHTVTRICQVPENTYPTRGCDSGGAFAAFMRQAQKVWNARLTADRPDTVCRPRRYSALHGPRISDVRCGYCESRYVRTASTRR